MALCSLNITCVLTAVHHSKHNVFSLSIPTINDPYDFGGR